MVSSVPRTHRAFSGFSVMQHKPTRSKERDPKNEVSPVRNFVYAFLHKLDNYSRIYLRPPGCSCPNQNGTRAAASFSAALHYIYTYTRRWINKPASHKVFRRPLTRWPTPTGHNSPGTWRFVYRTLTQKSFLTNLPYLAVAELWNVYFQLVPRAVFFSINVHGDFFYLPTCVA